MASEAELALSFRLPPRRTVGQLVDPAPSPRWPPRRTVGPSASDFCSASDVARQAAAVPGSWQDSGVKTLCIYPPLQRDFVLEAGVTGVLVQHRLPGLDKG